MGIGCPAWRLHVIRQSHQPWTQGRHFWPHTNWLQLIILFLCVHGTELATSEPSSLSTPIHLSEWALRNKTETTCEFCPDVFSTKICENVHCRTVILFFISVENVFGQMSQVCFATDLDAQLIQRNWGMSKTSAHLKGCQGGLTVSYSAFLFTSPPPFPLAFLITC